MRIKRTRVGKAAARAAVLVVDDHPIVREALAGLIDRQKDLACCGRAGSIAEACEAVASQKPALVLLDLRLGQADGLDSIKSLKARFPELKILVISQFDETVYAEQALRAGAMGYIMKEQVTEEVLQAIRNVLTGQRYVSSRISALAIGRMLKETTCASTSELSSLTDRELHVLKCLGAGKTTKEIAAELHLSVKTIETYREHLKQKLGLRSGSELVRYACQRFADGMG